MYFVPFASWVVPRDLRSASAASTSKEDKGKDKKGKEKKGKDKKTIEAKSGKKVGSWIVAHDKKGVPYWTNDVSDESTYRLLVQDTNHPAMPLKHVGDGKQPPWKLPLTAPSSKKEKKGNGGDGSTGRSKTKTKKDKHGGGCGGDENDSSTRMGVWEELFDTVSGTKIWYNTVTQKKTSKDPFF